MLIQPVFKFLLGASIAALGCGVLGAIMLIGTELSTPEAQGETDLIFIHHSVGNNWLNNNLKQELLAKSYIGNVNDIFYGTTLAPDENRPDSLQPLPGDYTNMDAWVFWFNDYLNGLKQYQNPGGIAQLIAPIERMITPRKPQLSVYFNQLKGDYSAEGNNKIVMFKSCFPNSNLGQNGAEPGSPFSLDRTIINNQAIFQHPDGPGQIYTHNDNSYQALEDIFAQNPDTLFVIVTSPPLHYAPVDATTDENAHRARQFNNWLKNDWLAQYQANNPGLNNVAVYDFFDVLAYPDDHPDHPNRLMAEYGGESGDSHPTDAANIATTQSFAANPNNFIDQAWNAFISSQVEVEPEASR